MKKGDKNGKESKMCRKNQGRKEMQEYSEREIEELCSS